MILPCETAPFDNRACTLGEGPMWHPGLGQLFWFDIPAGRLLSRDATGPLAWDFGEPVSAAGWVDRDTLLVASARALLRVEIATGRHEVVAPLEADNPVTRSNDGRADPWGGFWIGTMGRRAEPGAGAIWRYYRGELRRLHANITISNAICFAPDGGHACFTDTRSRVVMRQRLSPADGWPMGEAEPFIDLRSDGLDPDGAVIDAEGRIWIAQWGAGRVAVHGTDGRFGGAVGIAAAHASCPAFGGANLSTLYVTSALEGLSPEDRAAQPYAGMTFAAITSVRGQAEHPVLL